jgi:hypothetical protein
MNEVQIYDGGQGDIIVSRPAEVVVEEARRAAKVLTDVLAAKPKKVMMNNEQYLEFEDWQTVARFYGVTAKVKKTEFIDYGGVKGFLAIAAAVRADGMEISCAEAMCLNDEDKWSARTKYIYAYVWKDGSKTEEEPPRDQIVWVDNPSKPGRKLPKKERIAAGEISVPLFQLRSMAQTRACAKVLRTVFAWVVVLAGYRPVVAEELTGDEDFLHQEQAAPTMQKPQAKETPAPASDGDPVSENQIKAIHAMLKVLDITDDMEKHKKVSAVLGLPDVIASFNGLTKSQASFVIQKLGEESDAKRKAAL